MLNILLVDDESVVSESLQQILSQLGHHVQIASDGHEGLQMFDSKAYDLVITDIFMPVIDGHGVARHIRSSSRPYTPIIGISGTPWVLKRGIFDSVIPKPFNTQALTSAIDSVIQNGSTLRNPVKNKKNLGFRGIATSAFLTTRSAAVAPNHSS